MSADHIDLEEFLRSYLGAVPTERPRLTVTRRQERTKDSLSRLLAAGRQYLRLAQEDTKR